MRKISKYLFILLASLCLFSCVEQEPVWVEPAKTMSIEQANLVFEPKGGTSSFLVKAENAFTVESDRTWCTVSASGSEVTVTVTPNGSNETRYSRLTLTSGSEKLGITVHQAGLIIKGFSVGDKTVTSRGAVLEYPYSTNGELTVSTTTPWLKVEQTADMVRVTVEANTGEPRTGQVDYTLGDIAGSFSISQTAPFQVYNAWVPGYQGKEYYQGYLYETFCVKADASASAETYTLAVLSESQVDDASASSMNAFVEDVVYPAAIASLKEIVDYYEGKYALEQFLLKGSDYDFFLADNYPAGSYYVFAVGVDKDGNPTGKYAVTKVSTTPPAYNWWLGTWKATDLQGKVSTLTFAARENGKSYTVTGLYGYDFPLTVNFNQDGTVTFTGSSTKSLITSPYTSGTYVYSTLYFYGLYTAGSSSYYRTGDGYDIALGSRGGDGKVRVTGYWTTSSGTSYQYLQMVFRGRASNSGAAEANTVLARNYLPLTLEKQ
ncbi:MAG: BACON domain-containing protein [Bacteroidales bacterium]|nr:BACON domain-containing protein [Bacteroidales bacterium]